MSSPKDELKEAQLKILRQSRARIGSTPDALGKCQEEEDKFAKIQREIEDVKHIMMLDPVSGRSSDFGPLPPPHTSEHNSATFGGGEKKRPWWKAIGSWFGGGGSKK